MPWLDRTFSASSMTYFAKADIFTLFNAGIRTATPGRLALIVRLPLVSKMTGLLFSMRP